MNNQYINNPPTTILFLLMISYNYNQLLYIGYGTFAVKDFKQGDFLLEYRGERIAAKEGCNIEKQLTAEEAAFLYYFKFKKKIMWQVIFFIVYRCTILL